MTTVITTDNLDFFCRQLREGMDQYRCEGNERSRRDGCCAQIEMLVRLAECMLAEGGVPETEQGEVLEPIRELHAAVLSLNKGAKPRLLRPMMAGNRRPVELRDVMWRGEAAAAYELWMSAHRGTDKDRAVLSDEIAIKIGRGVKGASIREWHRNAKAKDHPYPDLTHRYEEMLQLAEADFPGQPTKAAEQLAKSSRKQVK